MAPFPKIKNVLVPLFQKPKEKMLAPVFKSRSKTRPGYPINHRKIGTSFASAVPVMFNLTKTIRDEKNI